MGDFVLLQQQVKRKNLPKNVITTNNTYLTKKVKIMV